MNKLSSVVALFIFFFIPRLLQAAPVISLSTDRPDAIYACGQEAVFTIEAKENGELLRSGTLHVSLGVAGGITLVSRDVDLATENPAHIRGTLTDPGFLLASAKGFSGSKEALSGAAFDPEKITMGDPLPADFELFWREGRTAIANHPVHLEKLDAYSNEDYVSYLVTVEVLHGERLYGFLSIPKGLGPFPALVHVPGSGPGLSAPLTDWAKRKVIALAMNVHKFPVIVGDAAATKRLYEEHLAKVYYPRDQAGNRDLYHFRNVILGVDRAIRELTLLPEWDRKHLVMDGSSQGGGMTLIMAGFNTNITAAAANVPALCDHGGWKLHRQSGWPGLASAGDAAKSVAPYFDAANFAAQTRCPVLVSVGFIDITCPPASIYAAWNRITAPKQMLPMPAVGHAVALEYNAVKTPWVERHLGLQNLPPGK